MVGFDPTIQGCLLDAHHVWPLDGRLKGGHDEEEKRRKRRNALEANTNDVVHAERSSTHVMVGPDPTIQGHLFDARHVRPLDGRLKGGHDERGETNGT